MPENDWNFYPENLYSTLSQPPRTPFPHTGSCTSCQAMTNFRRYIDGRGRALAQDREVVCFYALPHVPDPAAHPAFDLLFQDDWVVSGSICRVFHQHDGRDGGQRRTHIFHAVVIRQLNTCPREGGSLQGSVK